jgi:hypothetical protein
MNANGLPGGTRRQSNGECFGHPRAGAEELRERALVAHAGIEMRLDLIEPQTVELLTIDGQRRNSVVQGLRTISHGCLVR